jgi:Tfp pilus assembly protein PilN
MNATVNLIPDEVFMRSATKRRVSFWALVTCVTLAGIVAIGMVGRRNVRHTDAELDPLRQRIASMSEWNAHIAPLQDRLQRTHGRHLVVRELMREPEWTGFLADLSGAAGEELWLTHLGAAKDSDDEDARTTVSLEGIAFDNEGVSEFVAQLKASPRIQTLSIEHARTTTEDGLEGAVVFSLQGELKTPEH